MKTFFLLTFLGILGTNAQSVNLFTSDGNGADTFVRQGQPDNNFGNAASFTVKGGNGSTTRKGYVRFDLSTIGQPVTEATVTFTVASNNSGGTALTPGQTFNVDIYGLTNEALDDWVEGDGGTNNLPENEITYSNAPANVGPGNNFGPEALLLGTMNVPGTLVGETVSFSDPNLVSFLNSDTNGLVTLLMRRQAGGSNNLSFRSKESDDPPQLSLTLGSAVPLAISGLSFAPATNEVTLTWTNTGAASYVVALSTDLSDWSQNLGTATETADENPLEPDTITATFNLSG